MATSGMATSAQTDPNRPTKELSCLEYVKLHAAPGDATSVIKAMDSFSYTQWMMSIGDEKGPIIEEVLQEVKPKVMIELGGYVGYSAIRFSALLKQFQPDGSYYSFELQESFANIARQNIALAGLENIVTIIVGPFSKSIQTFRQHYGIEAIDVVFIDHSKLHYLKDLKLLESSGLFHKGTVVIADNVIVFNLEDYLNYVRTSPHYQSRLVKSYVEYTNSQQPDGIEISTWLG